MTCPTKRLNDLVEKVPTYLGDGVTTERLFAQETAFAALVRSGPKSRRYRFIATAFAATAATACLLFLFLSVFTTNEMPFFVGVSKERGEIGRWEETPTGAVSVFSFDQGSRIDLREKTMAKVASADEHNVQVTLRHGVIDTNIVGNGKTEWVVEAGPWQIIVVGTHFTVDWQQDSNSLEVAVTRGKVLVKPVDGPNRGVEVSGGQLFRAVDDQRIVAPIAAAKPRNALFSGRAQKSKPDLNTDLDWLPTGDEIATNESANDSSTQETKERQKATDTHGNSAKGDDAVIGKKGNGNRLEWLVHYANGEYETALASASTYGIKRLIEQLDAVRLWKLQDAARVTRKYDLSAKILRRFRERFPKDRNADVAGFLLGRIAMDKKQLPAASRWFNTYIAEAPTGPLAEEAHGLLIVVYDKMGRAEKAKQAAITYLNRYKGGAFAKIANVHIGNR